MNPQGALRRRAATAANVSRALLPRSAPPRLRWLQGAAVATATRSRSTPPQPAAPVLYARAVALRAAAPPPRSGSPPAATSRAPSPLSLGVALGPASARPRVALSGIAPPRWALRSPAGPRSSLFVRSLRAALPACSQDARCRRACPAAGPPPLCRAAARFRQRKNSDSGDGRALALGAAIALSWRSVAVAPSFAQRAVARVGRSRFGLARPRPRGPRALSSPRPRYAGER